MTKITSKTEITDMTEAQELRIKTCEYIQDARSSVAVPFHNYIKDVIEKYNKHDQEHEGFYDDVIKAIGMVVFNYINLDDMGRPLEVEQAKKDELSKRNIVEMIRSNE